MTKVKRIRNEKKENLRAGHLKKGILVTRERDTFENNIKQPFPRLLRPKLVDNLFGLHDPKCSACVHKVVHKSRWSAKKTPGGKTKSRPWRQNTRTSSIRRDNRQDDNNNNIRVLVALTRNGVLAEAKHAQSGQVSNIRGNYAWGCCWRLRPCSMRRRTSDGWSI